jgi:serine/threonine protein kinase
VAQITRDFTAEVSACCDLNHPNLVRLLGYADQPRLMLVHEFMRGGSLDQQLYVERWRPSASEVVGVALDVARGMAYLHTFSLQPTNDHELPIIHRDLKSGNLLLSHSPTAEDGDAGGEGGSRGRLVVKVADFGLSRDKQVEAERQQTLMMTGCGSMLWMAPEIVTGQIFNESVDVYSYAMCLVELLDCQLPWAGYGASIAHLAGRGDRPTRQLRPSWRERKEAGAGAEAGGAMALDERFASLVEECWCHDSSARPSFPAIVPRLEDMLTGGE